MDEQDGQDEIIEYLALVDGQRQGQKFCVSNPTLRQLVVEYALEKLAANPEADAISMEPSDGGGFCECAECAKIGSISSQIVLLANSNSNYDFLLHSGRHGCHPSTIIRKRFSKSWRVGLCPDRLVWP